MGDRPKFKQLLGYQEAWMGVTGFAAGGIDDIVTTQLSAAASSDDVPLQVGTEAAPTAPDSIVQGFVTTGDNNKSIIFDTTTKAAIVDDAGNEIFGRITEAAGVYTISYFSIVSGSETSVDIGSVTIDFFAGYIYPISKLPLDAMRRLRVTPVGEDPQNKVGRPIDDELVTVSALNTMANLAKLPSPNTTVWLAVNNLPAHEGAANSFTRVGKALTWDPVDAEYDLETTDKVIAHYFTLEA